MENHYQELKYQKNKGELYLKDLNAHLPEWVKRFVELYTSDLKYKIKEKIRTA